jgi:DNA-binding LytR/AlgR family response regulator
MCNYLLRCKLKTIEESFANSSLMRCHRSYIINSDKVKVIRKEKEGIYIDLDSEKVKSIPVSKGYSQKVMRYFGSDSV